MASSDPAYDHDALEGEFVAYLDGEVDDALARRVEACVGRDEAARRRLDGLERAWEALDVLPRADVDESFTRSTVEMIALSTAADVTRRRAEGPWRSRALVIAGLLAIPLAVFLGFAGYARWGPSPDRVLLENLPVIERLDEYEPIDSLEFLRQLNDSHVLQTPAPRAAEDATHGK
ncbi:MAG: anti-sigma factor [Pirellulales bacterium]